MFCVNCGKPDSDDQNFCASCGSAVKRTRVTGPVGAPVAAPPQSPVAYAAPPPVTEPPRPPNRVRRAAARGCAGAITSRAAAVTAPPQPPTAYAAPPPEPAAPSSYAAPPEPALESPGGKCSWCGGSIARGQTSCPRCGAPFPCPRRFQNPAGPNCPAAKDMAKLQFGQLLLPD